SSTPGVTIVTGSSTYGAIAPQAKVGGTPFRFTVASSALCGGAIDFTITTVSNLGTTSVPFRVRIGTRSGTDPVVIYQQASDLAIPDNTPTGVSNSINVTDDFEISDVDFRVDSLTHTFTGDVTIELMSPNEVGSDSISLIGGLVAGGGAGQNM